MSDFHLDGVAVVDKPAGMTSHDVVYAVRKKLHIKKVGHAGTLDPDATGVLVVGVGKGTRLLRFAQSAGKIYTGKIHFGAATTTLDASGDVTASFDMSSLSRENTVSAAFSLTGKIQQIPPMISSIKFQGKRLHRLAREGYEVEREPRSVEVYDFVILGFKESEDQRRHLKNAFSSDPAPVGPTAEVRVECSSGTYVRSLADDLGKLLGGGAFLSDLRRIQSGHFHVDNAVTPEDLDAESLRPIIDLLQDLPKIVVPSALAGAVLNGKVLTRAELSCDGLGPWALVDDTGELFGVYEPYTNSSIKPMLILANSM